MIYDIKQMKKIFGRIELCGCGTNVHWDIVQELLEKAEDHDKNGSFYGTEGSELAPWIEFGAKVIDGWGLIDHGTGIGWAWLTEDGTALLAFLRQYGTDSGDDNEHPWPDWATHSEGCPCGCEVADSTPPQKEK